MQADQFETTAYLHPMRGECKNALRQEGATIADIVREAEIDPRYMGTVQVVISHGVSASVVPMDQWGRVRPRAGTHVLITPRVHGPAAALLLSAVLPSVAATAAGALFTAGTLAYSLAYAAVTIVGSLLINALVPPPSTPAAAREDDPNFSITGSSNAETPYGIYPTVLGRHLIYPPKTARGYTEGEGENIHFRGRFTFGYGPVALESLRIGTTPITEFEGVELEFLNVDQAETLAHMPELAPLVRAWRSGDAPLTLYPDDVAEDSYSVALAQDNAILRATRDRTTSVSVDVTFQGLVRFDGNNNKQEHSADIRYRFRAVGAQAWTDAGTETFTGASTANLRFTKTIALPTEGEYEIEVTRLTAESDETTVRDSGFLTAIRSVRSGSLPSHADIAEVAVRIKASDQLNGQLETLNAVAMQMAPVWDGGAWSQPQPVRHPAWIYARALMGPMLSKPLTAERLQLDDLKDWADQEPHWTCDAVIDQATTVAEVLDLICATGRARRFLRDLKYSIIRDGAAGPVIAQFNPRNSWGFKGQITFPKEIHGFRVRCLSERLEWQQDEITVYADGYDVNTATEFETLELTGVVLSKDDTDGGNAWRLGRYHLAQAILRPESFSWQVDFEHLRVNMGDKARLVHDVPKVGVGAGRITEIILQNGDLSGFKLDEILTPEPGDYRVCIRLRNGDERIFRAAPPVDYTYIWTAQEAVSPAGIHIGDLLSIELMTQESLEVLITSIKHGEDLTATLTGVPAAPAVLTADEGEIPPYDPIITTVRPNSSLAPPPPEIRTARLNYFETISEAGGRELGFSAYLEWQPGSAHSVIDYVVYMITPRGGRIKLTETAATSGSFTLLEPGTYRFEVFARNAFGVSRPAMDVVTWSLKAQTPEPVAGFQADLSGNQLLLKWAPGESMVSHYELRFLEADAVGGWAQSILVDDAIQGNRLAVSARNGRYLIKAVSLFGTPSTAASAVLVEGAEILGTNVVERVIEHAHFAGAKSAGIGRVGGTLWLGSSSSISEWPSLSAVDTLLGFAGVVPSGVYNFYEIVDLTAVYTSRISSKIVAGGVLLNNTLDSWRHLSDVEALSGVDSSAWEVRLQVSTTRDDPHLEAVNWSNWMPLGIGDYLARAFRFRVILESKSSTVAVRLDRLEVTVDMPDRTDGGADLVCPPEGVYVPFSPAFKERPAIAVTGQGLPSDAVELRSNVSAEGFHQRFTDQSGQGVACSFDWIAKGYGHVL
ncbi:tail fiber protein, putative [Roseobacter sp. SK209-2-6]|uniref:host specificity factor TipJ family phage tail protein n=1 Tax=Roseobacter sp. SK209-2-6 TaxID=388739 RepID=UPI0000F3C5A9|nr:host specificity factor TipJ family phage tail protein [Roseobacter sp. SK209-2-6]EBA18407.1 tail fiber protein, putative [Roseobacter sp. SK209-2-6]